MSTDAAQLIHNLRRLAAATASDAELLERFVRRRDEEAFAALVVRHGPMVLRLCRRGLGDAHAAEDCFQATFLVLARKAGSVRRRDALASWLYGVATRVARKARVAGFHRQAGAMPNGAEAPADPRPDALAALTARELLTAVDEEVNRLPEVYRLPVILCCLEGRTREEAAQQLGWTEGSVKGRLERGRARLHARLVKRGLSLSAALVAVEVSRGAAGMPAALAADTARAALAGAAGAVGAALGKFKAVLVVLLVMGAVALGASLLTPSPPGKEGPSAPRQAVENAGRKTEREPVRAGVDRYGDPLPTGAVARLGTVRFRHEWEALALAFSPNGKVLAGTTNHGIILWDATSGKVLHRLPRPGHKSTHSIDFSPDGRTLAVSAFDPEMGGQSQLSLWDVASGKMLRTLSLPPGQDRPSVSGIRFTPDGKGLAVVGERSKVSVFDLPTGQYRSTTGPSRGEIYSLAFSPDGKTLALGTFEPGVQLWDAATGQKVREFDPHPGRSIDAIAYSRDGKLFASGSLDLVALSDPATGKEIIRCAAKIGWVLGLAFTPDGKTLVSGNQDGKLRVWDVPTLKVRHTLDGRGESSRCMALSRDGTTAAIGTVGQTVRLWDVASGKERFTQFGGHDSRINCLAFTPDGKALFTGSDNQQVRVWDTARWEQAKLLPGSARALSVSPDGKHLATVPYNKTVRLWDASSGRDRLALTVPDTDDVALARFSSDGKTIVTADWKDGKGENGRYTITRLRLWDSATGKGLREFALFDFWLTALVVVPDGKMVFATEARGGIYVCDVEAGRVRGRLRKEGYLFNSLALSADGALLLSANLGPETVVWETASGNEVLCLRGERCNVGAVALSPDGLVVATGEKYHTFYDEWERYVRLWDLTTGEEITKFCGHGADVTSLAFSPDGTRLVAGLGDSTALVWDVAKWTRTPRLAVKRLTAKELQALWADLGGADAPKAYRAGWALAAAPGQAAHFLRDRLRPVPPVDPPQLRQWIADLDSKDFAVRSRAQGALSRLGGQAEQAVVETLKGKPALEVRRRLEEIRKAVEGVPEPETLRTLRTIRVLERIGTPAARAVLEEIARGAPAAQETRAAQAALVRVSGKSAVP